MLSRFNSAFLIDLDKIKAHNHTNGYYNIIPISMIQSNYKVIIQNLATYQLAWILNYLNEGIRIVVYVFLKHQMSNYMWKSFVQVIKIAF